MKKLSELLLGCCCLTIFFLSCNKHYIPPPVTGSGSDSFKVTVANGYGTANYKVGDTVFIWSLALAANQTFDTWTGDTSNLKGLNEWHSWFIMPSKAVNLTANYKAVTLSIQYEKIKGQTNIKNVYYFFPANHKGIVYLFHGDNSSASFWVNNYEPTALIKDLAAAGYAVIITEAESVTTNVPYNGSLKWNTGTLDSVANPDFANLKAITDTFCHRGVTNRSIPWYSIGQSNGGSMSIAFSFVFKTKAAIANCASGGATTGVLNNTLVPILYTLQEWDNNSTMGASGNASAISNAQALVGRGVCSNYFVNQATPLYPDRFARNSLISITLSNQIFTEIKNNNLLTAKNEFKAYQGNLWSAVSAHPQLFPVLSALSSTNSNIVTEQLNCVVTDHQLNSDHDKEMIQFFNAPCH